MLQISVTCCILAAALAAPQGGRYLPAAPGGYGGRNANSIVQASALPRRFSVSKPASSQYGGSGGQSQQGGRQSNYGGGQTQYGGGQSKYGGGQSQYGGGQSKYGGGQSQYGGGQSKYGGGQSQYGGGSQYGGDASQYGSQDAYAEPANYDFSYEVNAPEYNVQFGHQESRQDMLARGSYRVLLPDGRTQVVEYEADQEGYRPTVTYQEAAGGRGGYGGGNGYGQSDGGYGSKGNAGKASYGQKDAYGSAVVKGGYKVSEQNQGYNRY